jgi:hypothetical protein
MNSTLRARIEMADVAKKMASGETGAIVGSRRIVQLWKRAGAPDDDVFLPFISNDAQSDDVEVGNRALWSPEFIERIDQQFGRYEQSAKRGIAEDCSALLAYLTPLLSACPACGGQCASPPYDAAGDPSYETCSSCGFVPGVSDPGSAPLGS